MIIRYGKIFCDACGQCVAEETPEGKAESPYFDVLLFPHMGETEDDLCLNLCVNCGPDVRAGIEVVLESLRGKNKQ